MLCCTHTYTLSPQALLKDPEKMKEATDKYHATIKAQQEGAAAVAATGEATSKAGATGTAGTDGANVLRDGGKEAVAAKAENEIGVGDDGEPLGPEADGLEVCSVSMHILCTCVLYRAALLYCMVITYSKSKDQPGKVANPACVQLNRENEYFSVPVHA